MRERILIINVNWIGDILFSTPFIRAVREAYPDSYIACLLHPRCVEMLESNPRINEIIIYDEERRHKGFLGKLGLIRAIRKGRFDTAFILHRSFTKAFIAYLAGTKERIGYPTKKRSMFLTTAVDEPLEETHKVEYFLNIAKGAGIIPKGREYEFFIKDDDRLFIKDFLSKNGIGDADVTVAICPGGNWDPKRWPKENFAKLADRIIEKLGVKIVICGAKKDIRLAEEIRSMMKGRPIIASGATTLKQLAALLERANLAIANDTGPMHIASAMGSNTIALFGPTSEYITGPHGKGRAIVISKNESCDVPCYDFTCKDYRCMSAITVDEVLSAAEKMLKNDN